MPTSWWPWRYSWPLPLHFSTHLTGDTAGDTGVYVWNQWVFRHELVEMGRLPYFTDRIFATSGYDANLSLHNYTPFQNLLALPFVQPLGVVAAFNVVMLATRVLTALATFLLARRVTGRGMESWLAGLVFAWSPVLVTRSMGHVSLVAAAPLAVFLRLLWTWRGRSWWWHAVGLGLTIAWATSADVYYGIYCLMLGGLFIATHLLTVSKRSVEVAYPWGKPVVNAASALLVSVITLVALTGGGQFDLLGLSVSVRSLYTPVLLLTALVVARLAFAYRVELTRPSRDTMWLGARAVGTAGAVAATALSPLLYAVASRITRSELDSAPIYWRNSPPGIDAMSLVIPNPNHPLAPEALRAWLSAPRPDAYLENVASIPLVVLAVAGLAVYLGWRPARWWWLVATAFGLLALGPFVRVGGLNTYVPGPWAVLRYVPLVGMTRTPARFSVVMMLAAAVLFASATVWVGARWPRWRRLGLAVVTVGLCLELLPAPLQLHFAGVPRIFDTVAAAPPETRVLDLPFGVRDGTTSEGDFSAQTQYFQTAHGRQLVGGYLSRVSRTRRQVIRREPVLDTLMRISESGVASATDEATLIRKGPDFLRRANVGFIVVNRRRVPPPVAALATGALQLQLVDADGDFDLYRPTGYR